MKNIRLIGIFIAVPVLLLIPYVAMKFTNEVDWKALDFAIAGFLLLSTGLACEFVLRTVKSVTGRVAVCAGILLLLFIVWAELAVGILGTPLAGS